MTTARELITDSYIDIGQHNPAQTLSPKLADYGLRVLNRMMAAWANENMMIPYTTTEDFESVATQASYTMGAGGTASETRARTLKDCYITGRGPLDIIDQRLYNSIRDKTLSGTRPLSVFYDPIYPIGILYFYPVPGGVFTINIETTKLLNDKMVLAGDFDLDTSYEEAIVLNLRNFLARPYIPVTQDMKNEARNAKTLIKNLNSANRQETMDMPATASGGRGLNTSGSHRGFESG